MAVVAGFVRPGFEAVADAFERNFELGLEHGAGLCVYVAGEVAIDITAGRDVANDRAFNADSLVIAQSATKGVTATSVGELIAAGLLDPGAPVSDYWPEFAAGGKESVSVEDVLCHRAGLPDVDPSAGLRGLDTLTGPRLTSVLAGSRPWWTPGSAWAYHATTFGTLAGEIVRRVSGQEVRHYVADHIAAPLGLEFWMGLPDHLRHRVAPATGFAAPGASAPRAAPADLAAVTERITAAFEASVTEFLAATDRSNTEAWNAYLGAEIPAAGGITNADGLARHYAALVSDVDGHRLLNDATLELMTRARNDFLPNVGPFGDEFRFGLGYQLPSPAMPGLSAASFGHPGSGGQLGFADPRFGVGFGYVCTNATWPGNGSDPRWVTILSALKGVTGAAPQASLPASETACQ